MMDLMQFICMFSFILLLIEGKTFPINKVNSRPKLQKTAFNVSAITWNLAETAPTLRDCAFMKEFCNDDLILLGLQECEDIRPRRQEGHRSRNWRSIRAKLLGKTHDCLMDHRLGGMQLSLYCKKQVDVPIKEMKVIEVPCGVGNVLSNKGAIAFVLKLGKQKSIVLVNSHLAAHESKCKQRNLDYRRIVQTILRETPSDWLLSPVSKSHVTNSLGTTSKWNPSLNKYFVGSIFMGDLNYRLDVPRLEVDRLQDKYNKLKNDLTKKSQEDVNNRVRKLRKDSSYLVGEEGDETSATYKSFKDQLECVLDLDQLTTEKKKNRIFKGFIEHEINFPPTYKYDKRSALFDSSKKRRCPAWTDRILYTIQGQNSKSSNSAVEVTTDMSNSTVNSTISPLIVQDGYYSLDVRTSDHRPVGASFKLNL